MKFVLANPPYNVQSDRNVDYAEYAVIDMCDTKDMAKFPGAVMKLEARGNVFMSAL